ncbi:MAG TPA: type I restriction enzyme HsdR N-terminal domain-containing protein, partial [Flavitalea sp.]|nr:type I restriction enzyme HsdR N-terminal domain-containing protein [Flavitalea sp.]
LFLGELTKRFDILVYDRNHLPWMMVECKSMGVQLDESVLLQILRYHIAIPVPYIVITNGSYCAAFQKVNGQLAELKELPGYI